MKHSQYAALVATMVLSSTLISTNAFAQNPEPLSFENSARLSAPEKIELPPLDNTVLQARDVQKADGGLPTTAIRYAEPREVSISPDGDWDTVVAPLSTSGEYMYVWRTTVSSPGALSMNLGFGQYFMPEGGALYIYTPDGENLIRPFTAADNEDHGQLWTPMLPGAEVVIEVNIPASQIDNLQLELNSVNHGYVGDSPQSVLENSLKSGSCNVDVVCPAGDGWRKQIRSVAAYSTGGGLFCTGSALNNTANDGRGFFLTADHCGINAQNAPSMVVYWNYENSYCRTPGSSDSGSNGDGSLSDFNTGAIFRAGYSPSDMTLVELDDPIAPEHNVYLAGWNASTSVPTSAVGIHHPNVDEKRISFEEQPLSIDGYGGGSGNTHLRVADWDLGTTEPGSSGSPLFDQDKRVVGQLTGGGAACGNNQSDWYGWMNVSWNGGGSSNSRLSNWLDAAGTGELVINGMEATGGEPEPPQPTDPPEPPSDNTLQNGVPVSGLAGSQGETVFYTFEVPADASTVDISLSGGSGDADLYVKYNSKPTTSSYDCRPYLSGNSETCSIDPAQAGTYHVMVRAYSTYSSASLVATYQTDGDGDTPGQSGENLDISIGTWQWFRHTIEVPEGASTLTVTTDSGSGDADLYLRANAAPTTFAYDCRPYLSGNDESCVIDNPEPGTWHVGIRGYRAASGVNERWSVE